MKHTQGEWKAIGKGGTNSGGSSKKHPCFNGYIVSENGQKIINQSTLIGIQGKTPAEAEANAKLIAAAPDLLEACKAILNYAHDDSKFPDVEAKVYAAIKKATE